MSAVMNTLMNILDFIMRLLAIACGCAIGGAIGILCIRQGELGIADLMLGVGITAAVTAYYVWCHKREGLKHER